MEKYGFVYIWRDRKHKRYYIGSHWGTENDGYICSSPWMNQAYKRRPKDFKRRILKIIISSKLDLLLEEYRWLSFIKKEEVKIRYYNLKIGGIGHWTTDELIGKSVKERISIKTKEAMQRPEVREKYLLGLQTRTNKPSEKRNQAIKESWSKDTEGNKKRRELNSERFKNLEFIKKYPKHGSNNGYYKHDIYEFIHKEYGEFIGTRYELIHKYNLNGPNVSALISGKRKSCVGWKMNK